MIAGGAKECQGNSPDVVANVFLANLLILLELLPQISGLKIAKSPEAHFENEQPPKAARSHEQTVSRSLCLPFPGVVAVNGSAVESYCCRRTNSWGQAYRAP